jgi:hypothetical protein
MSKTLQNSIWPNSDGKLGSIKTEIPDGVNVTWPDGDALIGKFVYKNDRLVGFVDTKALTLNDSKKTTIDYDYVEISLPCIGEGDLTVTRGSRSKYFNVKWGTTVEVEHNETFIFGGQIGEERHHWGDNSETTVSIIDNICYDSNGNVVKEINGSSYVGMSDG